MTQSFADRIAGMNKMYGLPVHAAPHNSRILAYFPAEASPWHAGWYVVRGNRSIKSSEYFWFLDDGESGELNYGPPTHWQPLPARPAIIAEIDRREKRG